MIPQQPYIIEKDTAVEQRVLLWKKSETERTAESLQENSMRELVNDPFYECSQILIHHLKWWSKRSGSDTQSNKNPMINVGL
jgi:hypothetical protein